MSKRILLLLTLVLTLLFSGSVQASNMDPGSGGAWWENSGISCNPSRTFWRRTDGYTTYQWVCAVDPRYGLWAVDPDDSNMDPGGTDGLGPCGFGNRGQMGVLYGYLFICDWRRPLGWAWYLVGPA